MAVLPMESVDHVPGAHKDQKAAPLELQLVVSHHMNAENWTQVFWKKQSSEVHALCYQFWSNKDKYCFMYLIQICQCLSKCSYWNTVHCTEVALPGKFFHNKDSRKWRLTFFLDVINIYSPLQHWLYKNILQIISHI